MAENKKPEGLIYKNHPLRRVDNFIYYGSMADKYIVLLQILDTVKEQDMDVAKVYPSSFSSPPRTSSPGTAWSRNPRRTASMPPWTWAASGWSAPSPASCKP